MPQCAVATCRNSHRRTRGRRIRYHRFPQIPEVRSRWVRACGRVPLVNGEIPFNIQTARICSLHFTQDSYEKDVEHQMLGLPARSRLRRGAVPTISVPVNVQPVTKMLVEDAKRSLLKDAHAKLLTGQKVAASGRGNNGDADATDGNKQQQHQRQQQHNPTDKRQHHQQQHNHCHHLYYNQRATNKNGTNHRASQEQKMAGIDVLLALGLKPAQRLNKMHAMEGSGGNGKRVDAAEKTREEDSSTTSPKIPQNQQNGAALPEETAAASTTTADRLRSSSIKKEPLADSELVETTTKKALSSSDGSQQKERAPTRSLKSDVVENLGRKRKSTEGQLSSNGNTTIKKFCLEQREREQYISFAVGYDKLSPDELAAKADQLRSEVQTLDMLARTKEMEWNEILCMRKLKEEAYLRIERKRQVLGFMEGNRQLGETLPPASLSLGPDWESSDSTTPVSKEKCSFESKEDVIPEESSQDLPTFKKEKSSKASSHRQVTPPKQTGENGRKQMEAMSPENRQIGEGRQGTIIDVRSIIADHKLRHPEHVPRRGRRMRNSVNVGLSAGGAMVETGHNVDSRPSSTDSCKSNSNANDPNNCVNFKDVLVQFAKMSQQQGEPVKTPQNYPDVTLHPVAPSATSQTMQTQSTGSLLHGILTKSQSPRPTTFSPTLARLLTAPERERNIPTVSLPQQSTGTHLLQPYQGSTPVSISDLLSSSKARTEITITPVVNTAIQSHSNNLIHVEDVEEEAAVIEDRETRISSGGRDNREDNAPRCQGCHECAAQFVCAGCGNQWYCSRECQVAAWDEHSELCTG
ncbi:protein kinase C-binding protein 1-like isoform X2 [Polistes fuscatus]|uniref:protein kinase C-binding protein 1-like isoform X2 n=1 Tax=Polistes fuscatus TaxID=30207 RepID=UPI001CA8B3D4|nr:protein kinase C-binding protein 1-like isoform X2 [Polistes fuscatus]XP_043490747.1 protein kinase C-binding protein 1-like isoform X2 [Polistes fuscatus]XP_043490748.1 protein kinase C-binding protein 1-like isoform X2 [Polistes fuscatus]XP_043490749.1 protein kinase C-binding protein 1-like isoform X2 [Polistes fuscatus]XP_043490750.1 protein kinase C-binding protein 1-like isoform X2 [Polistes fuscatus]